MSEANLFMPKVINKFCETLSFRGQPLSRCTKPPVFNQLLFDDFSNFHPVNYVWSVIKQRATDWSITLGSVALLLLVSQTAGQVILIITVVTGTVNKIYIKWKLVLMVTAWWDESLPYGHRMSQKPIMCSVWSNLYWLSKCKGSSTLLMQSGIETQWHRAAYKWV